MSKKNNYIIVIPTIIIHTDFYNEFIKTDKTIEFCINDGAFEKIKLTLDNNVREIIITYHTASGLLGSFKEFTHGNVINKYRLFNSEANLLLQHPALIMMTPDFNYVGLIKLHRRIKDTIVFK